MQWLVGEHKPTGEQERKEQNDSMMQKMYVSEAQIKRYQYRDGTS